jgi:hypothetical protein
LVQAIAEIEEEKARRRQVEAGKYGVEGGRGHLKEETLVPISEQGFSEEYTEEKGKSLEIAAKKVSL